MNLLLNATEETKIIGIELSTIDLLSLRLNIYHQKADRNASEPEAQCEQHLTAGNQQKTNCSTSESETQHEQCLTAVNSSA